jgi:hypothetical protein
MRTCKEPTPVDIPDGSVLRPVSLDRANIQLVVQHAARCQSSVRHDSCRVVGGAMHDVYLCNSSTCREPELLLPRERAVWHEKTGRQRGETAQLIAAAGVVSAVSVTAAQEFTAALGLKPPTTRLMNKYTVETRSDLIGVAEECMNANAEKIIARVVADEDLPDGSKRGKVFLNDAGETCVYIHAAGDAQFCHRSRKNAPSVSDAANYSIQDLESGLPIGLGNITRKCQCCEAHKAKGTRPAAAHLLGCAYAQSATHGSRGQMETDGGVACATQVWGWRVYIDGFLGDGDNATKLAIQAHSGGRIDALNCTGHFVNAFFGAFLPKCKQLQIKCGLRQGYAISGQVTAAIAQNVGDPEKIQRATLAVLEHHTAGSKHTTCDPAWCNYAAAVAAGDTDAASAYTPLGGCLNIEGGVRGFLFNQLQQVFAVRFTAAACVTIAGNYRNNGVESQWATSSKYMGGQRTDMNRTNGFWAAGAASAAEKSDPDWKIHLFEKRWLSAALPMRKLLALRAAAKAESRKRRMRPEQKEQRAKKRGKWWMKELSGGGAHAAGNYQSQGAEPDGSGPPQPAGKRAAPSGPSGTSEAKRTKSLCRNCRGGYHGVRQCPHPRTVVSRPKSKGLGINAAAKGFQAAVLARRTVATRVIPPAAP